MNSEEIYKHPLVQALLDQLPLASIKSPIEISFPIAKAFVDKERHIIAGYASVEVLDSQNELIPIPVLKDAWTHFKKNKDFYFGSLMHSNIPVIKVLDEYKDSQGQVWKSGVDENGLFIVAEVRQDISKGRQTWELIEAGKLTGYSIGGEAIASSTVCEGKCYTRVDKMELHEIAVVDRPANQPSVFKILKSDRLRKLAELTDLLPNLVISPGVAKLVGSTAEIGEGHDFDIIINATKGSFIDRAVQTRIHNELRKAGRLDLWKDVQIIHEPEGLGPYTAYFDLYDLVLLRAPLEKKEMVIDKQEGDLKERLQDKYDLNPGQAGMLVSMIGEADAKKLLGKEEKAESKEEIKVAIQKPDKIDKALSKLSCFCKSKYLECPVDQTITKASRERIDEALSRLFREE